MAEKAEHFIGLPEWLEGLTPAFLIILDDLVRQHGTLDATGRLRRLATDGPERVHVSSVLNEDYRAVLISRLEMGVKMNDVPPPCILGFGRDGNSYAVWQYGVTLAEIENLVNHLQSLSDSLCEMGVSGPPLDDHVEDARMSVDVIFNRRGKTAAPALGMSVERFKERFDRPGELAIIDTRRGTALCLNRDLWYVRLRERMVTRIIEVLVSKVLLDPQKKLSDEQIAHVYDQVERLLDERYPE
jgi:hypothetical protein